MLSLLALLFLLTATAHALPLTPYGPDRPVDDLHRGPGGWAISVRCKHNGAPDDCAVAASKDGRAVRTLAKTSVEPGVQWYGDIAMMRFPCGTGCRDDLFFSPPDRIDRHALIAEDAIDVRRRLVVSVASHPLRVFRLFFGKAPLATLRLRTSATQPDVQRLRWRGARLDVWYRDDAGHSIKASVATPSP